MFEHLSERCKRHGGVAAASSRCPHCHSAVVATLRHMKVPEEEIKELLAPDEETERQMADPVNHPKHYNAHPSGVECIQITEHMGFNLGNAIKYIWRADEKGAALEDLEKAVWYIKREIAKRTRKEGSAPIAGNLSDC